MPIYSRRYAPVPRDGWDREFTVNLSISEKHAVSFSTFFIAVAVLV